MTVPLVAPHVQAFVDRLSDEMPNGVLVGADEKPDGAGWQADGSFVDYVVVRDVPGGTVTPMLGRRYANTEVAVHTYAVAATPGNASDRRDEVREALTKARLSVDGRHVVSLDLAPMGVDREDTPEPTVWSGVDRWLLWTAEGDEEDS